MRPLDGAYSANRFLRSPLPPGAAGFTHPKTNTVQVWFNLAAGTAGTHTAGASTLLYSTKAIEAFGGGWYRCAVEVTSPTITVITASLASAAADNTTCANGNSIAAGRAQLEADAALTNQTTYIPTTSAQVTRGADNLYIDTDPRWYNPNEGTIVFEWWNRPVTPTTGGQSQIYGGFGATFNDSAYISRFINTQLVLNTRAAGVGYSAITRPYTWPASTILRMAMAWANNDAAFCIDGGAVSSHALCPLPAAAVRVSIGGAPWSEPSSSSVA